MNAPTTSRARPYFRIGFLLLALLMMWSCDNCNGPTKDCETAMDCAVVISKANSTCANFSYGGSAISWLGHDKHPKKTIIVSYRETVEHLNQSKPNDVHFLAYQEAPFKDADLGCQYVQVPGARDYYDKFTWVPITSCFVGDDPACVTTDAIPEVPHDCSQSCTGPYCTNLVLDPSDPEQKQAAVDAQKSIADILNRPVLTTIDVSQLLSVKQACPERGGILIDNNGKFTESGPTCRKYLTVRPALKLATTLPPSMTGTFTRSLHTNATLLFDDPVTAPVLEWYDQNDASLGEEPVDRIEIRPQGFKIMGKLHYCIWLTVAEAKGKSH